MSGSLLSLSISTLPRLMPIALLTTAVITAAFDPAEKQMEAMQETAPT